jgi:hypothetical protein
MVDTATTAWVNAVVAAGGSVSGARQTAVDNLIVGLKTDSLFGGSKVGGLWVLRAENTQSALIDLIALAVATPVASPSFTIDAGYTFNGSNSYLDLGSLPASYIKDSAHVAVWSTAVPVWALIGHYDGSYGVELAYYSGQWQIGLGPNDPTPAATGAAGGTGFAVLTRTASNARAFYVNGTSVYSDATTSGALCVAPLFVGGIDYLGGLIHPSTGTVTVVSIGGGLTATDNTKLKARLDTYFAAITGGGATTLPAAAGSYALTGTAAAFATKLTAAGGSYTIAGTAASFISPTKLPAAAGSYTVTGVSAALKLGLVAGAGSYTITGTAAAFLGKLTAAAGAYTITGTAAVFVRKQTAAAGAYTITGTAANFVATANFVLPAAAGAYNITGNAAAFQIGGNTVIAASPGAYTITGTAATFIAGVTTTFTADAGAYAITGSPATLVVANTLPAAAGAYAITGTAATFNISDNRVLAADAGSYTITGSPASFVVTSTGPVILTADPGAYTITGTAASFLLVAAPGPGGGYAGAVYRTRPLHKKRKREELEELLEYIQEQRPPDMPPALPETPGPPPPPLIDLVPKQIAPTLRAAPLTPPQRKVVARAIVTDDEDDDDEAVELLLNLLS